MKRLGAVVLLLGASALAGGAQELALPNRPASLKFAAIGDNGTGDQPEYDIGRQMAAYHRRFPFELVIMLGDNMYGRQDPQDFVRKFEAPFRPLLDGTTNWPAVVDAFDKIGYRGYLTFEYFHPYPHYPEALIYQTSDSLDRMLGKKT